MTSPFLVGLLSAWAIAQVANGAFFVLAYALGRRERDYLSFALLSLALAAMSAAVAWTYAESDPTEALRILGLAHAGGIAACVLNIHFVVRFVHSPYTHRILRIAYPLAIVFAIVLAADLWWEPGSARTQVSYVLGLTLRYHVATPTWLGALFYPVVGLSLVTAAVLIYSAQRAGRREALTPLLGVSVVTLAAINDVALAADLTTNTMYLLPHAFMVYAFGFASTLLYRYGRTAGALEQTATDLERTTGELWDSYAELEVVQVELEKSKELAIVGELAAAIAHEVRNPLAIIMNAVAGLRRESVGPQDRLTLLEIVDEETARLNRLTDDLLRFARPVAVKKVSASLVDLAEKTSSLAQEHRVIVSRRDGAPTHVQADPNLLRQAMDNLVENACQSMPGGGDVHIVIDRETGPDGELAKVEFTDTGQGMTPDVLERALDPFFTTRPSGTGLGLPIVRRITEAHGGSLSIDSEPGVGTRVTLRLSCSDQDAGDQETSVA